MTTIINGSSVFMVVQCYTLQSCRSGGYEGHRRSDTAPSALRARVLVAHKRRCFGVCSSVQPSGGKRGRDRWILGRRCATAAPRGETRVLVNFGYQFRGGSHVCRDWERRGGEKEREVLGKRILRPARVGELQQRGRWYC
eukprot:803683-Amorphochlora_amoeboformis.AAC.1